MVTANIDTYKTILYIHKMTKNIYLKYLSFLAAAGLMSYTLYYTIKSVNDIDRILNDLDKARGNGKD